MPGTIISAITIANRIFLPGNSILANTYADREAMNRHPPTPAAATITVFNTYLQVWLRATAILLKRSGSVGYHFV